MRSRSWALLFAILLPLAADAQETRGNISGTVRDNHGVIPGATVKVTNVETKVSQSLVSNGSGYYEAPLLIPGTYEVRVQMQGFKSPGHAQRFLAAQGPIRDHFCPRRHRLPAQHYREAMQERFVVWNTITGVAMAT